MKKVSSCLTLLIFLPFIAVGVVMIILGLQPMPPGATEDGVEIVKTVYLGVGASFLGATVLFGGLFLLFAIVSRRKTQNLLANGVQGTAQVLSVNDTGVFMNNQPQVEVQMQITLPNMQSYVAQKRVVVPHSKMAQVTAGAIVNILVDPSDPTNPNKIGLLLQ